jgi:hypothetical protein
VKPLNVDHPMLRRVRVRKRPVQDPLGRSLAPRPRRPVTSGSGESVGKAPAVHVPWLRGIDHARDDVTTTDNGGEPWVDSRRRR